MSDFQDPNITPSFQVKKAKAKAIADAREAQDLKCLEYYKNGKSTKEISNILNIGVVSVRNGLLRKGEVIKDNRPSKISDGTQQDVVWGYKQGVSVKMLASQHNVTPSTIRRVLYSHGIKLDISALSIIKDDKTRKDIVDRYVSGENTASLALAYSCSDSVIRKILSDQNIQKRDPNAPYYARYDDRLGKIWRMRSTWEVRFAKYLDELCVNWNYEERSFDVMPKRTYTPDFWIRDGNKNLICVVDVKGLFRPLSKKKTALFKQLYPEYPFLLLDERLLRELGILNNYYLDGREKPYRADLEERIKDAYKAGNSLGKVSRSFGVSQGFTASVLRSAGLMALSQTGKVNNQRVFTKHRLLKEMVEQQATWQELLDTFKIGTVKLGLLMNEMGLSTKKFTIVGEKRDLVLKWYHEGLTITEIGTKLGDVASHTVKVFLEKEGLETDYTARVPAIPDSKKEEILMLLSKGTPKKEIAALFGCDRGTVDRFLEKHQVHHQFRTYAKDYHDQIVELYGQGLLVKEIAKQVGFSDYNAISRYLRSLGLPPSKRNLETRKTALAKLKLT